MTLEGPSASVAPCWSDEGVHGPEPGEVTDSCQTGEFPVEGHTAKHVELTAKSPPYAHKSPVSGAEQIPLNTDGTLGEHDVKLNPYSRINWRRAPVILSCCPCIAVLVFVVASACTGGILPLALVAGTVSLCCGLAGMAFIADRRASHIQRLADHGVSKCIHHPQTLRSLEDKAAFLHCRAALERLARRWVRSETRRGSKPSNDEIRAYIEYRAEQLCDAINWKQLTDREGYSPGVKCRLEQLIPEGNCSPDDLQHLRRGVGLVLQEPTAPEEELMAEGNSTRFASRVWS